MRDHSFHHLAYEEGLSFDLVDAENLFAGQMHLQIVCEHTRVELGYNDAFVFRKNLYRVLGQRIDIAELPEGDLAAGGVEFCGCCQQMTVCASA